MFLMKIKILITLLILLATQTVSVLADANNVLVNLKVAGSSIKRHLSLGDGSKSINTGALLPVILYLEENSAKYTNGVVSFKIYQNNILMHDDVVRDNGAGSDLKPNDGIYNTFYMPTIEGDYDLVVVINGNNLLNEVFESGFTKTFSAITVPYSVSSDYIEETNDLDSDGFADELVLNMPITSSLPSTGVINVYAKIKVGNKGYLDYFRAINVSENKIYAKFNGRKIRKLGYSGPFQVIKFQYSYNGVFIESFNDLKDTSFFDISTWERENLEYTTVFSDMAVDLDGDNFYDVIRVAFGVDSNLDASSLGDYGFTVKVYYEDGTFISKYGVSVVDIPLGINDVILDIPASSLRLSCDNFKLVLRDLSVYPNFNADAILRVKEPGTTGLYKCRDFAKK